jgi:hypothetical protein
MTVRGRLGLASAAFVVVAALALLFWPQPLTGTDVSASAGPHQVRLMIDIPAAGARTVTVDVTGTVDRVDLAPAMVEMGHAGMPVTATEISAGHFRATDVEFFMSGRWDIGITVHGPDGPAEVTVPVLIAR